MRFVLATQTSNLRNGDVNAAPMLKSVEVGGAPLLSVQCSDSRFAETAKRILDTTGARDVLLPGQQKAA
jgi:hypothetical protein